MVWMWGLSERDTGQLCVATHKMGSFVWVGGGTTGGVWVMPRAPPPASV